MSLMFNSNLNAKLFKENRDGYIEPDIRPVCDVLNAIEDVKTVYSCEGHMSRLSRPFVMFDAPPDIALKIHRLLGYGHGDGTLKLNWCMTSRFQDDGSMRYIIEPNDFRVPFDIWSIKSWTLWLDMKNELDRLSNLLKQVKIAQN